MFGIYHRFTSLLHHNNHYNSSELLAQTEVLTKMLKMTSKSNGIAGHIRSTVQYSVNGNFFLENNPYREARSYYAIAYHIYMT